MPPKTPMTLAIETSNPPRAGSGGSGGYAGVALVSDGAALGMCELDRSSSRDDALVRAVDRCCDEAGVAPGEIGRIAVSVGPGGYTSVRIAVTVAKTLASVTGAELVSVPTALAVARASREELTGCERAFVCLAWKHADVWVMPFERGEPAGDGRIVTLEELAETDADVIIADKPLADALRATNPAFLLREVAPVFDPLAVAAVSWSLPSVEPSRLVPLYPREPEAKRLWEQNRR